MSKLGKKSAKGSFNPDWKNALKLYLVKPEDHSSVVYFDTEFSAISDKYPKG